jgi:hypothetical protein
MNTLHSRPNLVSSSLQSGVFITQDTRLDWSVETLGRECKALGKLGNIVVETFVILDVSSNVSQFAHPWKHCCGNKICFLRSKNVS